MASSRAGSRGHGKGRTRRSTSTATRSGSDSRRDGTVSSPVTAIVTILATIAGVLALAVGVTGIGPAAVAAVAGCLLTATVTATKRRTPGGRAVGSVFVVFAAVSMAGAIGFAASSGPLDVTALSRVGVVVSIGLATFGATATLTGAIGGGAVRSAIPVATLTTLPITVVAAIHTGPVRSGWSAVTSAGWADGGRTVVERLLAPDGTVVGLVTFTALLVGLLWVAYFVLPRLPIPELLPRDRRKPVRGRIRKIASRAGVAGMIVLVTGVATGAVLQIHEHAELAYVDEVVAVLEPALVPVAMSSAIRSGILVAVATLWLLWLLSKLPVLHRLRHSVLVTWGPVFTGGVLVAVLVVVGYPVVFERLVRPELEALAVDGGLVVPGLGGEVPVEEILGVVSPPEGNVIVSIAIVAVIGTVVSLLIGIWLTGSLKLLPDRGAPGSLGASALVTGGIFAAIDGATALIVGIAVAAAIVSWDAAVYGVSITEELDRNTAARLPAIAHATGAVVVGGVGIGLALALNRLAQRLTVRTGVTIAVSLTVALLALFVVLKRRAKVGPEDDRHEPAGPSASSNRTAATETNSRSDPAAGTRDDSELPDADPATIDVTVDTVPILDRREARNLRASGFETIGDLQAASTDDVAAVKGVHTAKAETIKSAVEKDESDSIDVSNPPVDR